MKKIHTVYKENKNLTILLIIGTVLTLVFLYFDINDKEYDFWTGFFQNLIADIFILILIVFWIERGQGAQKAKNEKLRDMKYLFRVLVMNSVIVKDMAKNLKSDMNNVITFWTMADSIIEYRDKFHYWFKDDIFMVLNFENTCNQLDKINRLITVSLGKIETEYVSYFNDSIEIYINGKENLKIESLEILISKLTDSLSKILGENNISLTT